MQVVNKVGYEAHRLIVKQLEVLGECTFQEIFQAVVFASEVCLANALRLAIEKAPNRATTADNLVGVAARQVRELVEPAVRGA